MRAGRVEQRVTHRFFAIRGRQLGPVAELETLSQARESRKIFVMRKAIWVMLLAVVSGSATAAWGQEATINAEVVRKAILEVPIWHLDRSTGTSMWHFEMRGDKLWAKIAVIGGKNIPDVQIEVTNEGLTWMGPDGQQITMRYDPRDIQYPFKGADTQGRPYEFTPK
jgi:hypothetical protein